MANSHITIKANGKPLTLPADFSIDIEDQNPLFNDNEMYSYPVQIPMSGNRFLLGNMDDAQSAARPVDLEHTPMRIIVDGLPFRSGTLVTTDSEEINNSLTMNISGSEHSLSDLIGDLSCRDIPVMDKILIGEKIGNVKAKITSSFKVEIKYDGKKADNIWQPESSETAAVAFSPQALGFSCPGECVIKSGSSIQEAVKEKEVIYDDHHSRIQPKIKTSYINVSESYPQKPYCNARVAYYHHAADPDDDSKTSTDINPIEKRNGPENIWPYWVLDADRQQSGICFYVLYFLDCLFHYLGVTFDNSELTKVEDMNRLCFFTTHCKYDEEVKHQNRQPYFTKLDDINKWLKSRGTGGRLEFKDGENMIVNNVDYTDNNGERHIVNVGNDGVASITIHPNVKNRSIQADIMQMYANSENFPDGSVQTVLDSLWASFGIKFDYDYDKKHVRAYFVRDIFRADADVVALPLQVISSPKVGEKITGFRMKYENESSPKDQQANVRNKVRDYDTSYDYIDYPKPPKTETSKTYAEIFRAPNQSGANGNMTTYIDQNTGNAYRIKINGDAERARDMKPVLFEVGQWKGVEIGDCSPLNEDYVEEISSDFVPVDFNDVNYQNELSMAVGTYNGNAVDKNGKSSYATSVSLNQQNIQQPILSAFIDEDMEHEFIEQRVRNAFGSSVCEYYLDQVLNLVENYDPSNTDDGNSPLQSVDWGLAIAINRGGGTNATMQVYDYNYDGFGNSRWRTVSGLYALTSDSIDMWGNEYDYNGTSDGIGSGERFSLKIRSWKQPEWADKPLVKEDETDANGDVIKKIRSRGLFETFMASYGNFVINRRKYNISAICSPAVLADIPNHWNSRFRIGNLVGYINKVSYTISSSEGIKDVKIELFVV